MRVLRGRADDPETDRERSAAMLDRTAETGEPAGRVWTPHRQVAFGRRDARADGYAAAAEAAREHGFPPLERSVGGRAVAYTGSTVAFARVEPVADIRVGLDERYDALTTAVQRACWRLSVPAQRGEPPNSFCPGQHSLQADGKLAGVAQRVTLDAALVSGVLVVDGHDEIAGVLADIYDALGVAFDPGSVGSLARAGGRTDPEAVCRTLESALVGDADEVEVVRVDEE
jgi:lipoate-protein ligase A